MRKSAVWAVLGAGYITYGFQCCIVIPTRDSIAYDKGTSISREQQDDYSIQSYESHCGNQCRRFPVGEGSSGGSWRQREAKCYRAKADGVDILDAAKLRKLRPAFKEGGTVTAGNASSISDGAAALFRLVFLPVRA
ncbi:hypothetical protein R1sor_013564 [Riccia sorocarpa]|uniref:Thiolase N-terminal domain-containing protein n=1 Tax=Riccia sorocarpa TaxID=122646 RepID=A0ABD3H6X5_9MARC